MDIRNFSDDFFSIGKISILNRNTHNDRYDFNFRNNFACQSIISETANPVLLHIGAVEDYAGVEACIGEMGMKLLVNEKEHLRCSTIESWYPSLKERTPFTMIFDELPAVTEIMKYFEFPVFIKGNRQTNRHKRSQCIIENAASYEKLRQEWKSDPVLHWQKVAVRAYVPLLTIDDVSFPDQVPISYEFRFFYFQGECVGYGPYWYMGNPYTLLPEDASQAFALAKWAEERLAVSFPAIDLAKTASGEWIIIEVNDAQESGFVGVNPISLWSNMIRAFQRKTRCQSIMHDGIPFPVTIPSSVLSRDKMSDATFDAMMQRGLAQAKADDSYDVDDGFDELEKGL